MASKRQIEANRRNARLSTGPKSHQGRLAASRNARRHGLSMPMEITPEKTRTLTDLRDLLKADENLTDDSEILKHVAESHLEVRRVREARHAAILALLVSNNVQQCSALTSFLRYERAALTRRRKSLSAFFENLIAINHIAKTGRADSCLPITL